MYVLFYEGALTVKYVFVALSSLDAGCRQDAHTTL